MPQVILGVVIALVTVRAERRRRERQLDHAFVRGFRTELARLLEVRGG